MQMAADAKIDLKKQKSLMGRNIGFRIQGEPNIPTFNKHISKNPKQSGLDNIREKGKYLR